MSDLISRQDALDALAKFVPYAICDKSTESYTNGLTDAYNLICQLPSAQPEIIRCKDCTRFDKKRGCNLVEGLNIAKADSFCSWAERRGEEDEVN